MLTFVSYSIFPQKSLMVPASATAPILDGKLHDQVWQIAETFSDFEIYQKKGLPKAMTQVKVLRYKKDLYFGVQCDEPEKVYADHCLNGSSIWQGDLIEIHFGGVDPKAWSLQLAVGAGGGMFSDSGNNDLWEAKTCVTKNGWSAEVKVPLKMLLITDSAVGFNVCRQRYATGECSTWSPLRFTFHEPENFGELLLINYDDAALIRFGLTPEVKLNRKTYQQFAAKHTMEATAVTHGPYLSNPTRTGMTISWETAGCTAAFIEYREKNSDPWIQKPVALKNGVHRTEYKLHVTDVTNLKPGTSYEYRLLNRVSYFPELKYFPGGHFTTLSLEKKNYRFGVFSDIHGDSAMLEKLWRNSDVQTADFYVNLGDMLSSLSGPLSFFNGFIDKETRLFAKERPLVMVRGNHDFRGFYAGGYFDYMHHPSGRTYYTFKHGPVLFIVLDSMRDYDDHNLNSELFMKEQKEWLQKIIGSADFQQARFRVVLMHFPIWDNEKYYTQVAQNLIKDALDQTSPENRIQLMIGGHEHDYFRINPNAANVKLLNGEALTVEIPKVPFAVVANDGPGCRGVEGSILSVDVTEDSLNVKAFGPDGKILDSFYVFPDTSIKEG